ncbi:MAG: hypothetical protein M5U26_09880 [Planctomycetota bacterium]|nr:hypothetical protein [Planctomycetota bacterium]
MRRPLTPYLLLALAACAVFFTLPSARGSEVEQKLLRDVETADDIRGWDVVKGSAEVSAERALAGKASLKVAPGAYLTLLTQSRMVGDWSGYDVLAIDFFNAGEKPQPLSILLGDKDWLSDPKGANYWNRHNSNWVIPPGAWTFKLPLQGLFRGEAGSRYNDFKYAIKPAEIVRLDLGIGHEKDRDAGAVFLDNIRLLAAKAPEGIKAFDFGPPEQNLTMGFTAVTWDTVYSKESGYGLDRKLWHVNRGRDDTFPPGAFLRDWICMSEDQEDWEFVVDLPNGTYTVSTAFSDAGYWGGEAAKHRVRKVWAEGQEVYSEDHGEKGYAWRVNHLFEDIEPRPGDDFWDLYCSKFYAPVNFKVEVKDGQLNLKWHADSHFSCKVAGLIVYPAEKQAAGDAFVAKLWDEEREAFRVAAAMQPTPEGGSLDALPAAEKEKGWLFFLSDLEQDTFCTTIPAPEQMVRETNVFAARGEFEPVGFAVRPLKDLGPARVEVGEFKGPGGAVLPASAWSVRAVRHLSRRGFSAIGYKIIPQTLREFETIELPAGFTREFVATVRVPADAQPGAYQGSLTIGSDGGLKESLKVTVHVLPVALDECEFVFGFFGHPPTDAIAKLLVDYGFNSFSGGPGVQLKGFEADGTPQLDFARIDAFMERARAAGYTRELCGYGGPGIEHIGYVKDDAFFGAWEQKTGKSYAELLKAVFDAVKARADEKKWLPFTYNLGDEPRNIEVARKMVEQVKAVQEAAPWLKTTAQYSVTYKEGSKENDFHQWLFEAIKSSGLNLHDESVRKKAEELGKEIYVYNQGQSRFSFGLYQWSEYRKGVKGRYQWHQHVQHGFQFFDLDGREPDTGVLYYGKDGPIVTLMLERCREGVDDLRYLQTLWSLASKSDAPAAREALAWLDGLEKKIAYGERKQPADLDNRAVRATCAAWILKLSGLPVPPELESK